MADCFHFFSSFVVMFLLLFGIEASWTWTCTIHLFIFVRLSFISAMVQCTVEIRKTFCNLQTMQSSDERKTKRNKLEVNVEANCSSNQMFRIIWLQWNFWKWTLLIIALMLSACADEFASGIQSILAYFMNELMKFNIFKSFRLKMNGFQWKFIFKNNKHQDRFQIWNHLNTKKEKKKSCWTEIYAV